MSKMDNSSGYFHPSASKTTRSKKTRIIVLALAFVLVFCTGYVVSFFGHDAIVSTGDTIVSTVSPPTSRPPKLRGHYAPLPSSATSPMSFSHFTKKPKLSAAWACYTEAGKYAYSASEYNHTSTAVHDMLSDRYNDYLSDFLRIINGLGLGDEWYIVFSTVELRQFFVSIVDASSEERPIKFTQQSSAHLEEANLKMVNSGEVVRQLYLGEQLLCEFTFDFDSDESFNATLQLLENPFEFEPQALYFDFELEDSDNPESVYASKADWKRCPWQNQ